VTEEEVLERVGGKHSGMVMFEDGEMWHVLGDRALQMRKSRKQERLELAPMQWEADAIGKRGTVTETLLDESPYGILPDSLPRAIKWLQRYLDKVPPKLRTKARVSFDTTMEYGETYPRIRITYSRPETDEEWAARKADLAERVAHHEGLRRQEFERLRAEFDGAHNAHSGDAKP
jgi:hypothetical protein